VGLIQYEFNLGAVFLRPGKALHIAQVFMTINNKTPGTEWLRYRVGSYY